MKLTHPTTSYIVLGKVYAPGQEVTLPDGDAAIPGLMKLGFVPDKPAEQELDAAKKGDAPKPLTQAEKMAAGRAAAAKRKAEAKAAAQAEDDATS